MLDVTPQAIEYTIGGKRIVVPGFLEPPPGMTHYPPEWGLISLAAASRLSKWSSYQLRKRMNELTLFGCRNPYHPRILWVLEADILALPQQPPFYR